VGVKQRGAVPGPVGGSASPVRSTPRRTRRDRDERGGTATNAAGPRRPRSRRGRSVGRSPTSPPAAPQRGTGASEGSQVVADVLGTPVQPVTVKRATLHGTALHAPEVLARTPNGTHPLCPGAPGASRLLPQPSRAIRSALPSGHRPAQPPLTTGPPRDLDEHRVPRPRPRANHMRAMTPRRRSGSGRATSLTACRLRFAVPPAGNADLVSDPLKPLVVLGTRGDTIRRLLVSWSFASPVSPGATAISRSP
jgi:hypothetical protein